LSLAPISLKMEGVDISFHMVRNIYNNHHKKNDYQKK